MYFASQDRLSLTWETSDNEENEFLRLQVQAFIHPEMNTRK